LGIKSTLRCFLLATAGLSAQSADKLNSDLRGNAVTQQITSDILALAEKDAEPSRRTVADFAEELTKAVAGRQLTVENVRPVTQAILEVLQSSGVASYRFHASIDHFRDSLIALNATAAQAKSAAGRLLILGQEVHGPEDLGTR
jgi:hypothetical protein